MIIKLNGNNYSIYFYTEYSKCLFLFLLQWIVLHRNNLLSIIFYIWKKNRGVTAYSYGIEGNKERANKIQWFLSCPINQYHRRMQENIKLMNKERKLNHVLNAYMWLSELYF